MTLFYEQLNCVLITYFRVWKTLMLALGASPHSHQPSSKAPIHVDPNELGVGYGLPLVPCERQQLISIYWE